MGEILYDFLDNEEHGFTLFQEMETDEIKNNVWNCIIDTVAYISKVSYEEKGIKYLPESIELVDDNIFTHMINNLFLCNSLEMIYIENIYQECMSTQEL